MYLGFVIYISIIAIIAAFILSRKFRCFFVAVILFALIVFGACALQNAAKADEIKHGIITRVAPELFNSYPVLVITVETFDGQIYTYYSEEEIDVQGTVILTLFGDEVLDVE